MKFLSVVFLLLLSVSSYSASLAPSLQQQAKLPSSNASAEVLYSIEESRVEPDHHWKSVEYYSIRINDLSAARDYGRITISYNHYYSDLSLEFANVLTPDGKIKSVNADAIQERAAGSQDFYEDRSALVFSLPEIAPGSILEFQTLRSSKRLAFPDVFSWSSGSYWYQPTVGGNGARIDPVMHSRMSLDTPAGMKLFVHSSGQQKPHYHEEKHQQRKTQTWTWQQLPKIYVEPFMPSYDSIMSRVIVSTSRNWQDVDAWTWRLVANKLRHSKQLAEIAHSLVKADAGREEKIKAVYGFMQENIRYVFAHLGRGGYEPHSPQETLQQRYGDCKDQTVLTIALLRELGIDAYPALVVTPRNGRPPMDLVSLYFDHMIVWIPASDDSTTSSTEAADTVEWLDTTADRALYPGISNYLVNQSVLISNGKGGRLTTLNEQIVANKVAIDLDYVFDSTHQLQVSAHIQPQGLYEQNLRSWWIHDNNRDTTLEQIISSFFPEAKGKMQIEAQVVNDTDLWKPFEIVATLNFNTADSATQIGTQVAPHEPIILGAGIYQSYRIFGSLSDLQVPGSRHNRWVNPQPADIRLNVSMKAPENEIPAVISSGIDFDTDFFSISQSSRQEGNRYLISIGFARDNLDLSPSEYHRYYDAINNLKSAGHWAVSYSTVSNQNRLAGIKDSINENDLHDQLALARYYLQQGEFDRAIAPAKAATEIDSSSGEAWYILGVAQGYSALVEESEKSFSRATALGYTP